MAQPFLPELTFEPAAGTCWHALQDQLETIHQEVRSFAETGGRYGVLITRHGHNAYTLAVGPEVPYGMTYEH
ncbi:hypothetical protein [Paenarthrobacter sp. NPDC058040]|uniref:hypothetical protein n=1 Tax=unclassified Paenarthrobacter TaxID=2634190 RepID=UPI0036DBF560